MQNSGRAAVAAREHDNLTTYALTQCPTTLTICVGDVAGVPRSNQNVTVLSHAPRTRTHSFAQIDRGGAPFSGTVVLHCQNNHLGSWRQAGMRAYCRYRSESSRSACTGPQAWRFPRWAGRSAAAATRKDAWLDAGHVAYDELNLVGARPNEARSIGSGPEHPLLVHRGREKSNSRA